MSWQKSLGEKLKKFAQRKEFISVAVTVVAIGVALYKLQWKLIYLPGQIVIGGARSPKQNGQYFRHPSERGLNCEDLEILAADGVILRGWFIKQENYEKKPTVIFFHENAGNLGQRMRYFQSYHQIIGCNIMAIAYGGYSDSDGSPDESGIQKDAIAILEYALSRPDLQSSRLIAHGRSLGGQIHSQKGRRSCRNLWRREFAWLYLWIDPRKHIHIHLGCSVSYGSLYLCNDKSDFEKSVGDKENHRIGVDPNTFYQKYVMFFIRAIHDEIVPDLQMQKLRSLAKPELVSEIAFEIGGHNDNWFINKTEYFKSISEFVYRHH